jgi:hypothetical protein
VNRNLGTIIVNPFEGKSGAFINIIHNVSRESGGNRKKLTPLIWNYLSISVILGRIKLTYGKPAL